MNTTPTPHTPHSDGGDRGAAAAEPETAPSPRNPRRDELARMVPSNAQARRRVMAALLRRLQSGEGGR